MRKLFFLFTLTIVKITPISAQTDGNLFFNHSNVHEIYITFNQSSYWDSLVAGYNGDYYIKGNVEIDGTLMYDCGVKLKGNSSYNNPSIKKSMKLDFNEWVSGQKYDGLKKINLNNGFKDPTFMREKLMLDFLRENNAYAPRSHYANVYLNGTYWGLYITVEEIDKTFLEYNFNDKKGNLFKGDPTGDLRWINSLQSSYETKYELKTNETENDWTDLMAFINTLNNTPTNLDQSLDTIFDYQNYSITWAAHLLFSNLDSYQGSGHNYYLYFDSTALKFRYITWDVNEAFGVFTQGMNVTQLEQLSYTYAPNPAGSRPLTEKLLTNANYINLYIQRLCDLLQYNFTNLPFDAKIDSIANVIRPHVYADPNKFFSNQNFEDNLSSNITVGSGPGSFTYPGLKSFITNRRNSLAQQLSGFCTVGVEDETKLDMQIFPNPTGNQLTCVIESNSNSFTVTNLLGEVFLTGTLENGKNEINLSNLPNGIYFFNVQNGNIGVTKTEKLIKL